MGTVYRALQNPMGRDVAIKILRGDAVDDSAKARFLREARANSLLASPNTVTVFDFGESETGEFYLAMELLEGESLGQRLSRVGRIPAPLAVDACRQALRSLARRTRRGSSIATSSPTTCSSDAFSRAPRSTDGADGLARRATTRS